MENALGGGLRRQRTSGLLMMRGLQMREYREQAARIVVFRVFGRWFALVHTPRSGNHFYAVLREPPWDKVNFTLIRTYPLKHVVNFRYSWLHCLD